MRPILSSPLPISKPLASINATVKVADRIFFENLIVSFLLLNTNCENLIQFLIDKTDSLDQIGT